MLKLIHEATLELARQKLVLGGYLWPGMSRDIEHHKQKRTTASSCSSHIPFAKVGADILKFGGKSYLVVYDYFSKWLEIVKLCNKQGSSVISTLKDIFCNHGIPKIVVADNKPFSSYECTSFAHELDFEIHSSSLLYSQSNGMAEKCVGIAKIILRKIEEKRKEY
ncbi:hypothetical protein PR048_026887 [Dryococelus australis]|uniref:Integrase catalytic domain-containing protein n=1 Tax=Dryococelus australis TaxID=614101 RepID=A0ABQ9GMM3_9NEOP|nr:hypothetical protein PR048_026887 [Dryococelus australis]